MIKILLACMGGMSTSLLAQNMAKAAKTMGLSAAVVGIMSERDYITSQSVQADIVISYTSVMALNYESLKNSTGDEFHVFMIGPQSRFMLPRIQRIREELKLPEVPHCIIESELYGRGNGRAVLDMALDTINEFNDRVRTN